MRKWEWKWKWKWKTRQKPLPFAEEEIQAKAYELWQQRGDESSAEENWKDAIAVLARERYLKQVLKPVRRF